MYTSFLKVMAYCLSLHSYQGWTVSEWKYENTKFTTWVHSSSVLCVVLTGNASSLNKYHSVTSHALTLASPSKTSLPSQTDHILRPIIPCPNTVTFWHCHFLRRSLPFSLFGSFALNSVTCWLTPAPLGERDLLFTAPHLYPWNTSSAPNYFLNGSSHWIRGVKPN